MSAIDKKALYNLSYGLFVLTSNDGTKSNGCIINTCMQITENPTQLCVCVNKANYTAETISKTKKFAVSILTTSTPFSVFEHFGFRSGRDVDKFSDFSTVGVTLILFGLVRSRFNTERKSQL